MTRIHPTLQCRVIFLQLKTLIYKPWARNSLPFPLSQVNRYSLPLLFLKSPSKTNFYSKTSCLTLISKFWRDMKIASISSLRRVSRSISKTFSPPQNWLSWRLILMRGSSRRSRPRINQMSFSSSSTKPSQTWSLSSPGTCLRTVKWRFGSSSLPKLSLPSLWQRECPRGVIISFLQALRHFTIWGSLSRSTFSRAHRLGRIIRQTLTLSTISKKRTSVPTSNSYSPPLAWRS